MAEYSATFDSRQKSGICWYPIRRTVYTVNQGGTADVYSSLTDEKSVNDFLFALLEVYYGIFTKV